MLLSSTNTFAPRSTGDGAPSGTAPAPTRVCVIDLGTNSFHAVIADAFPNGTFTILDKFKEMVRLGERGLVEHRLTDAAMRRSIRTLRRIRNLARGWQVDEFMAYATSAIREASNGGSFIKRVRDELGVLVRTIDGQLEAHLIYEGVRQAVDLPAPALLVDIGGGSTEFIIGTSEETFFETSLKVGAARMTAEFITTDPVDKDELKRLREHYRTVLEPVLAAARAHGVREIVGSSGTMENLAQVCVNLYGDASRSIFKQDLSGEDLRRVTKAILKASKEEREAMDGMEAKRAGQIVAGALLVDVLLKDLSPERVRLSPNALREGMVVHFIHQNYERLEQLAPYVEVRRRSIYELGFRYRWEERHVVHVTALALQLFDACAEIHGMGEQERELLEYASLLHDVGYHISRTSHHKHSFYLIKNAELRGFQPEEIDILAHVTRYHRGALPKGKHIAFERLSKDLQRTVLKLAAFLRLAEGLDRSHFQNVLRMEIELSKKQLKLMLETKSDPQLDAWGARRGGDLFEAVYERKVVVEAHVLRRAEASAMV